jgi:peroxiredoxin
MVEGKAVDIAIEQLTAGKRVVLFAVPGAFTPTCSARHLPGYLENANAFRSRGVEEIACLAVNDAFVVDAWAKSQSVGADIVMLSDGNGQFTRAIGLDQDLSAFGMGLRSKRYSMLVTDGVVEVMNVEEGGEFRVSSADYLLSQMG